MAPIDLTARMKNFAIYLPSIQPGSAERLVKPASTWRDGLLPAGLTPGDFDYFDPSNRCWSYLNGLASAEAFRGSADNIVTHRTQGTFLVGDSGGFQYGKGSGEVAEWRGLSREDEVASRWQNSGIVEKVVDWQEANADVGLTLDLPLWAARPANKRSPFHLCSEAKLRELSMENLRYLRDRKQSRGLKARYLNVLQGEQEEDEEAWYMDVRSISLEGWSFAGRVGTDGGPYRILRRLLLLRDHKHLERGADLIHLLKQTQLRWAPVLTAIQRAMQKSLCRDEFRLTYDSSTPYQEAGARMNYAARPALGTDVRDWHFRYNKFPDGYGYANSNVPMQLNCTTCTGKKCALCDRGEQHLPQPLTSPLADLLNIQDLLIRKDADARRRADGFCDELLINHNVFTVVEGIVRANEAVFAAHPVAPQQLIDAVGLVGDIIAAEQGHSKLLAGRNELERAVGFKRT